MRSLPAKRSANDTICISATLRRSARAGDTAHICGANAQPRRAARHTRRSNRALDLLSHGRQRPRDIRACRRTAHNGHICRVDTDRQARHVPGKEIYRSTALWGPAGFPDDQRQARRQLSHQRVPAAFPHGLVQQARTAPSFSALGANVRRTHCSLPVPRSIPVRSTYVSLAWLWRPAETKTKRFTLIKLQPARSR